MSQHVKKANLPNVVVTHDALLNFAKRHRLHALTQWCFNGFKFLHSQDNFSILPHSPSHDFPSNTG